MGVKYIRRNGKTITIDTETGKELKFGDRLKNKIRKGVINFSNKPFGLDYSKYKGTDQWDDKKKRFLTQNEVNKRDTSNLPNAKKTSAYIRGTQKKNDKSSNNLKINKEEKKEEKKVVKNKEKSPEISLKDSIKMSASMDKPLIKKADGNKKKIGPNRYNLKSDSKVHVMKNFIKVDGKLYKTKGPHNNNLKKLLKIRKKNKKK